MDNFWLLIILFSISLMINIMLIYCFYNEIEPWRIVVDDYARTFLRGETDKRQTSISEELVREIFQNYFQKPFPKIRPTWLTYHTGSPLELDGYNDELKIAFEFNGIQHYQYPNIYSKSYEDFEEQKKRDIFKQKACKANGIKLHVIPYTVKPYYLRKYIVTLLTAS